MNNEEDSGENPIGVNAEKTDHTGKFVAIFVILALLIIGEIYSMSRLGTLRSDTRAQQAELAKKLNSELSAQVQQLANANAQSLEELRSSLDDTANQMSATEKQALSRAHHANYAILKLERRENQNAQQIRQELAQKADQQQVGTLSQGLTTTRTDLAQTKTNVDTLAKDLGMARSKLGTLIATNSQDIAALEKLGNRDYYEFELIRKERKTVAGVTLILKKANMKHHNYNVDMIYSDMKFSRKNLPLDSPVFFAPRYTHQFYELVVYQLGPRWVKGYISTPKGALAQVADPGAE